jgi:hypothetical protein
MHVVTGIREPGEDGSERNPGESEKNTQTTNAHAVNPLAAHSPNPVGAPSPATSQ